MKFLNRLFYDGRCICLYRNISEEEKKEIPNPKKRFKYNVIPVPKRYWIGDPFPIEEKDKVYLFVEQFDRYKSKAFLGCLEIIPHIGKLIPIYEFNAHSSYPNIFKWRDEYYIVPESGKRGKLSLLHCKSFPYEWEEKSILIENMNLADCTVFEYNGNLKIFLYERLFPQKGNILYIADLDVDKGKVHDLKFLKEYNNNSGRPGGNVILINNDYVRIVQPGISRYGEKIEFYKFNINSKGYTEKKIGEFNPYQIIPNDPIRFNGTHTFNRCRSVEVIDVINDKEFNLFRPIRVLFQLIGILGFDLGDRRNNYVNKIFNIDIE